VKKTSSKREEEKDAPVPKDVLQEEKESLARDLLHLKDEHERANVSLSNLEMEMEQLKRQRDELEEKVKRTQRNLDSVEQRMIQRTLPPLPKEIYLEVTKHVHESEALAFAMTCTSFRDAMKDTLKAREGNTKTKTKRNWLRTSRKHYKMTDPVPVSEDWIKWAFCMEWKYVAKRKKSEENKVKFLTYLAAHGGLKGALIWLKSQGCILDDKEAYVSYSFHSFCFSFCGKRYSLE
jgi:hypothetical protein